jgi:hypothetical protein
VKAVVLVALVALGLSSVGCASQRVRTPAYGPQVLPDASWQVVASAPPPVEASEPGAPPNARVVWIDGQWLYQRVSRKWVWEKGAWCEPPAGAAYYAAPVVRRVRITGRPSLRWNEAESRGEEILPSEDEWSWARGTFFVRDARGAVLPMSGSPTCTPATGLGDPTAK